MANSYLDSSKMGKMDQHVVRAVNFWLRYNKTKAATIRQRAIRTHGGVAVDGGDAHIGSKHVIELILNHGPPKVAVDLLANSVRTVRLVDPADA